MSIKPYFQSKNTRNVKPDELEAPAELNKLKAPAKPDELKAPAELDELEAPLPTLEVP
jgi:hypothetical protein